MKPVDPRLLLEPCEVHTTEGTVVGTCHYIAPESLLAAGWTLEQVQRSAKVEETWEGWESDVSSFHDSDQVTTSMVQRLLDWLGSDA